MANPQILNSEANMSNAANTRQIRLVRRTSSYWRVTFDNPPLNIFGPETIPELNEIVTALETDEDVKVVVFDSAVEGFFLTHYDFLAKLEDTARFATRSDGVAAGSRHAGAPKPRSGRLHRLNPRARDRHWKRTCACKRYALCESR